MVSHLVSRFGTAAQGGVPIYELDNEPVLWAHTHRDVHPELVTYDELGSKGTATAAAIKAADPSAAVLGPSGWGYCEWVASGVDGCGPGADSAAHGGLNLSQWYLKNMKDYSDAHGGKRFLDYFDQHFYPQIGGGKDPESNALRLRSTRSLWDPTYVEESWIGPGGVNAPPLQFIRTMKSWIDQYNPGTKTAITEYNWGALDDINGALAQADVLGIFGREGLDLATMWGEPKPTDPGAYAFRMYRNYDGAGSRFGDVSVSATSADQGQLAVYAAQRSSDDALTVMVVNKTGEDLTSPLSTGRVRRNRCGATVHLRPGEPGRDRARRRSPGERRSCRRDVSGELHHAAGPAARRVFGEPARQRRLEHRTRRDGDRHQRAPHGDGRVAGQLDVARRPAGHELVEHHPEAGRRPRGRRGRRVERLHRCGWQHHVRVPGHRQSGRAGVALHPDLRRRSMTSPAGAAGPARRSGARREPVQGVKPPHTAWSWPAAVAITP